MAILRKHSGGTLISINSGGDSFIMGDGTYGPDVIQTISNNFRMSKHEITNSQFQLFVDAGGYSNSGYWTTNGATQRNSGSWVAPLYWTAAKRGTAGASPDANFDDDNQLVVGVSWYEAVAFCNWLSVQEGLTPVSDSAGRANLFASGYRLPTEVEWEYAAAKGQSGVSERIYPWGDTAPTDCALVAGDIGSCGNSRTEDVGSKSPNGDTPQGLTDMSGNVYEWMSGNYQVDVSVVSGTDRYYFVDDQTGSRSINRGGAWDSTAESSFRGAWRINAALNARFNFNGFRVLLPAR